MDLRNRFYSPDIARFLQPDLIGFAGDQTNLYRYAGNTPVTRRDPFGLGSGTQPTAQELSSEYTAESLLRLRRIEAMPECQASTAGTYLAFTYASAAMNRPVAEDDQLRRTAMPS